MTGNAPNFKSEFMLLSLSKSRLQYEPVTLGSAAIIGGSALLGTGGTMAMTGKMNAKNRRFQEEQAWKADQRNIANWERQNRYNEWAIQGDRKYAQDMWAQQNQYDSPAAQMERYRAAGLNPNMIYGQSNMGAGINFRDSEESAPIPGANKADYQPRPAPEVDLLSGIMSINRFKSDQAQRDLVAEQIKTQRQQQAFLAANTVRTAAEGGLKEFELKNAQELFDLTVDGAKAKNELTWSNANEAMRNYWEQGELQEGRKTLQQQDIEAGKKRIEGLGLDNQLKALTANLKKNGFNEGDPVWIRVIVQFLQQNGLLEKFLK